MGDKSFSILNQILETVIKSDCQKGERILNEYEGGCDVQILFENRRNLDGRIEAWERRFLTSVRETQLTHDLITLSAGVYEMDTTDVDMREDCASKAAFSQRFGRIYSNPSIRYYDESLYQSTRRLRYLETQAKTAMQERQLQVYLQPQYHIASQKIVGAEALVRWNHPKLGFLCPDEFIPLFEWNRTILQMDFYILEEVCKLIQKWHSSGWPVFPISVNFSKLHLSTNDFVERFLALLEKYQINPMDVHVEWTESELAAQNELVGQMNQRLRSRGIQIAVDDFGSGYSTLNLLSQMPADIVKLDKEFLHFQRQDMQRRYLLEQIVHMAKGLNLVTIAEGVEYPEQAELLLEMGCEYAQGFLYSRPINIPDYENLIRISSRLPENPASIYSYF